MNKYEAIRTEVKKLSSEQRFYKPLRKTSNGVDNITRIGINPEHATSITMFNKRVLRHLFQAYAILKGKDRPIITKSNHEISEGVVAEMVEKYRPVEVELAEDEVS